MKTLKLGLIGDNIAESRSPALHRACARVAGVELTYERLIPRAMGRTFDGVFDGAERDGFRGVNVTQPYKERVRSRIALIDPRIATIGSVNTVRFDPEGPHGFNTDYSGFIAAYRAAFSQASPGRVVLFGAGGVGKAVAFGLVKLGATEIIVSDPDEVKAKTLIASLGLGAPARLGGADALHAADGVINCSPLGMAGYPGSPVPDGAFPKNGWAFDAVYTPVETSFRTQALTAGAAFLSGFELFFFQGTQAFEIFTGCRIRDNETVRKILMTELQTAA